MDRFQTLLAKSTCGATAWAREAERWLPPLQPRHLHVIQGTADKFAFEHVRAAVEARRVFKNESAAAGQGLRLDYVRAQLEQLQDTFMSQLVDMVDIGAHVELNWERV
jgi:hypothetical protein